jgi:hypothetical protein
MAWEDELFAYLDDLEEQAAALYDAERLPDLADRERAEYQQVTLGARLMASVDLEVVLDVLGVGPVAGRLARVADGWVVVTGHHQDWVVRTAAVSSAAGLSARAVPEVAWPVVARLRVGSALRRLADGAVPCSLHLLDGRRHDGVVRRVGADFAEIATGDAGRLVLVSFDSLAAVQSRRPA